MTYELSSLGAGSKVDPAIARIASRQHGVVARRQLLALGIGADAINHRLARERLHPVHRGVYLVGHPVPAPLAKEMAAVLACGEGAVLTHESAASAVWRLCSETRGPTHITLPSRSNRSRPGIRVHRTRALEPHDLRRRRGLPVTAPARTLLDLALVFSLRDLRRAYEGARVQRLLRDSELLAAMDRSPGHRGAPALRAVLEEGVRPSITRSEAEVRVLDLLRAADIPPSATNAGVGRYQVDFLWRRERLIVEVDGFTYHASRAAFERDRQRDAELQAAGYRVMRVTWNQISSRPEAIVARVAQALAIARLQPAIGEEPREPHLHHSDRREPRP